MKYTPICCLCLLLLLGTAAVAQTPKTAENVELSAEAKQLLEEIKAGVKKNNAKRKRGVIDFTLTLSAPQRIPPPKQKNTLEEKGRWDITYQFDAEHRFYDVKARYKMELNGRPLPNWKETHHQYLQEGKTVHVWEKIGTEWKEQPTIPSHRLEEEFNPMFWINGYSNFRIFTPIAVEKVEKKDETVYALTLHRTDSTSNSTRTIEMSRDSRKGFLPTRILVNRKSMESYLITGGGHPERHTVEESRFTLYTYHLEQFEPDIWFPQIMRMEHRVLDKNQQPKPPSYILTMQVQRAIFNIPIEQKDLPITLEK